MESVAIRRKLQTRPARWCASWRRPKLADRAAEWGSVSSWSRSAALAIKTPCTHRCRRGEEKHIRQRVCAAAFGCNSCLGYCSSSSSSVCCMRLSVRALLRADGRSQQKPTINTNKNRRSILTVVTTLASCATTHRGQAAVSLVCWLLCCAGPSFHIPEAKHRSGMTSRKMP
jgi:hypothetical protein